MERGRDFLRAQVGNAIMQHRALVENLESHARQAQDLRFRELCYRTLPNVLNHQRMLEEYGRSIGAEGETGVKGAIGNVLAWARDAVDAVRESDFLKLVGDEVMIRQAEDTFATFSAVGEAIGEPRLADIGHECQRDHEQMGRDFQTLIKTFFIEHVQGTEGPRVDHARSEARPM